jgi:hypothetical protein
MDEYDVVVVGARPAGENVRGTTTRHAAPSFPTVSGVWPRLLDSYGL